MRRHLAHMPEHAIVKSRHHHPVIRIALADHGKGAVGHFDPLAFYLYEKRKGGISPQEKSERRNADALAPIRPSLIGAEPRTGIHSRERVSREVFNRAGRIGPAIQRGVVEYHGFTVAYPMVNASLGVKFVGGMVTLSVKAINIFDETLQSSFALA